MDIDPESTDIFAQNIMDKYMQRPDELEDLCYADFAANFRSDSASNPKLDEESKEAITQPVSDFIETPESSIKITLKDDGKMKKRSRPCVIRWYKKSKLKDPESFYQTLLQLYMPWRNFDEIKDEDQTYAMKFIDVSERIDENLKRHQPYDDIDSEELQDAFLREMDHSDSESENEENEYSALHPGIVEYSDDEQIRVPRGDITTSSHIMTNLFLNNDTFYSMCNQLNKKQKNLFYFVSKHIQRVKHGLEPDPFFIFMTGGGGVGKSFTIKAIAEIARRELRFSNQDNQKQPSLMLTASTGIAAVAIDGTTIHSGFSIHTSCQPLSKKGDKLANLQNEFNFLKIVFIDEISMVSLKLFNRLDQHLRLIMNQDVPFGGVSILAVGDFCQLPPVKHQLPVYALSSKNSLEALGPNVWADNFKIYELKEIMRQSQDPVFAAILNRARLGENTDADFIELEN